MRRVHKIYFEFQNELPFHFFGWVHLSPSENPGSGVVACDPNQSGEINPNKCSQSVNNPLSAHSASFGDSVYSLPSGFRMCDDRCGDRYDLRHISETELLCHTSFF